MGNNLPIIIGNTKDHSIVRIGCHDISNRSLSEVFYLSRNSSFETDKNSYCSKVMGTRNNSVSIKTRPELNPEVRNSIDDDSDSSTETTEGNAIIDKLDSKKLQHCDMAGSDEINCEGCDVRFYHNGIDRDYIFNPVEESEEPNDKGEGRVGKL